MAKKQYTHTELMKLAIDVMNKSVNTKYKRNE